MPFTEISVHFALNGDRLPLPSWVNLTWGGAAAVVQFARDVAYNFEGWQPPPGLAAIAEWQTRHRQPAEIAAAGTEIFAWAWSETQSERERLLLRLAVSRATVGIGAYMVNDSVTDPQNPRSWRVAVLGEGREIERVYNELGAIEQALSRLLDDSFAATDPEASGRLGAGLAAASLLLDAPELGANAGYYDRLAAVGSALLALGEQGYLDRSWVWSTCSHIHSVTHLGMRRSPEWAKSPDLAPALQALERVQNRAFTLVGLDPTGWAPAVRAASALVR